ncbi:MAG: hypothetical protein ACTTGW_00115 [Candidatus Cryptobacteroides sp.]
MQGPLRQGGGEKTCSGKANLPTARASLCLQGPLRQGGGEKTCSGKANLPTASASLRLQGPLRQGGGEKTCSGKANLPTARASLCLQGPLRQGGGEKTCSGKANLQKASGLRSACKDRSGKEEEKRFAAARLISRRHQGFVPLARAAPARRRRKDLQRQG